jgi:hypothetical protein
MAKKLRNTKSGSGSSSPKRLSRSAPLVRQGKSASSKNRSKNQEASLSRQTLSRRSQTARDRALHVIASMRRDSTLSLSRAARLKEVKSSTVLKYFRSDFKKSAGKFRVTKRDRHPETLYVPNSQGQIVPRQTHSSKERRQASEFLRDLARYRRNEPNNLPEWKNRTIGGIDLLTDPAIIRAIESAPSDFSLYRGIGGNE